MLTQEKETATGVHLYKEQKPRWVKYSAELMKVQGVYQEGTYFIVLVEAKGQNPPTGGVTYLTALPHAAGQPLTFRFTDLQPQKPLQANFDPPFDVTIGLKLQDGVEYIIVEDLDGAHTVPVRFQGV